MINVIENANIFTDAEIEAIMEEVVKAAEAELGDRLSDVILYGSYARGDNREWSDIDVMVLVETDDFEANYIKNILMDRLWRLIYETNLLLSIIVVSASRYEQYKDILPFYTNVAREGRRVYA